MRLFAALLLCVAMGCRRDAVRTAVEVAPFAAPRFERRVLATEFWAEGASFADLDRDGDQDVIAGPFWYEGPDFTRRHAFYEGKPFDPAIYSNNFFVFPHDFDGDRWVDLLIVGFPGQETFWYQNPRGADRAWDRHLVLASTDNESPVLTDLTGDGRPDLVCNSAGTFGYATADPADPRAAWRWHPISARGGWGAFTHGLGVGDIDGDGRADVLHKGGWFQQPRALAEGAPWVHHDVPFAQNGGAQMFTQDLDGDGDNDVITSLAAHGWGLSWYEQVRRNGAIGFVPHVVLPADGSRSPSGVQFAELHALARADIDGDGLLDLVTGKRWWSHGAKGDPETEPRAVVYWFRLVRAGGSASLQPYLVDGDSGVGTQVVAGDVSGDGRPDVVIANKKGVFVLQRRP